MNYLLRNRKSDTHLLRAPLFTLLFVALLFGVDYLSDGKVRSTVRSGAAVLWSAETALHDDVLASVDYLRSKESLIAERDALRERVGALELLELNNLVLLAEHDELRALLGGPGFGAVSNKVPARVISNGGILPYGTMAIDNTAKVARVGDVVFGESDIALGTILETTARYATVHLYFAPGRTQDVLIGVGENTNAVTIEGMGNGNFLAHVPRDTPISVKDPVTLPQAGGAIIGFVGSVEVGPADAFQDIRIKTPVDTRTLRFVLIGKD